MQRSGVLQPKISLRVPESYRHEADTNFSETIFWMCPRHTPRDENSQRSAFLGPTGPGPQGAISS